ncbi:MAG: DUF6514 family protein [Oscillospiraceae bacterium]|nr:DUF6514 family protein [Oscillospiraceae bacterium]
MRKIPIGEARPENSGQILRYAVVIDEIAAPCGTEDDGSELEVYGIEVSTESDTALVRGLTLNATYVLSLAKALCGASVTPVHTREILEDLLTV